MNSRLFFCKSSSEVSNSLQSKENSVWVALNHSTSNAQYDPKEIKSISQIKCKFIKKLLEMLECREINDIISWTEEGEAFIIKNLKGFIEEILPRFYKHGKLSNFIRQLNMYNFKKLKKTTSSVDEKSSQLVYSNPLFKKDSFMSISSINRKMGVNARNIGLLNDSNSKEVSIEQINNLLINNNNYYDLVPEKIKSFSSISSRISPLRSKLVFLKSKHKKHLSNKRSILNKIEKQEVYIKKLDETLMFLLSQVSKLPNCNVSENIYKENGIFNIVSQAEDSDPFSINNFTYQQQISKVINDDLSTVLQTTIHNYRLYLEKSVKLKRERFTTENCLNDSSGLSLKFSHLDDQFSDLRPCNFRSESSFKSSNDSKKSICLVTNKSYLCLSEEPENQNLFTK